MLQKNHQRVTFTEFLQKLAQHPEAGTVEGADPGIVLSTNTQETTFSCSYDELKAGLNDCSDSQMKLLADRGWVATIM